MYSTVYKWSYMHKHRHCARLTFQSPGKKKRRKTTTKTVVVPCWSRNYHVHIFNCLSTKRFSLILFGLFFLCFQKCFVFLVYFVLEMLHAVSSTIFLFFFLFHCFSIDMVFKLFSFLFKNSTFVLFFPIKHDTQHMQGIRTNGQQLL